MTLETAAHVERPVADDEQEMDELTRLADEVRDDPEFPRYSKDDLLSEWVSVKGNQEAISKLPTYEEVRARANAQTTAQVI